MRLLDLGRDKTVWVGSIVVLLLLTLLPFSSPPEGMFAALQQGNRAHSFWSQMEQLPLLNGMFALLLVNILVALFGFGKRLKARLLLGLNLLGVLLFVLQFVFLSPEIRLGVGSFVLFFTFLLFLSQSLSRLGLVRGWAASTVNFAPAW